MSRQANKNTEVAEMAARLWHFVMLKLCVKGLFSTVRFRPLDDSWDGTDDIP